MVFTGLVCVVYGVVVIRAVRTCRIVCGIVHFEMPSRPVGPAPVTVDDLEGRHAGRVNHVCWIVQRIIVEILSPKESHRIFRRETPGFPVIVSGAIVVISGPLIELAAGKLERIFECAGAGYELAKSIVCVRIDKRSGRIGERRNAA